MPAARVGAIVLHYRLVGPAEAPVLAFANSLGTDFRIWDEVARPLTESFRVIRHDKRGHGLSELRAGGAVIADFAGDLAALLDRLAIRSAVVVGLSIGGMIAQELYRTRPDLVGALVLCDTAHRIGGPEFWAARIGAVEAGGIESIADGVMERWFTKDFRDNSSDELAGMRAMLTRTPQPAISPPARALRDANLTEAAKSIRGPDAMPRRRRGRLDARRTRARTARASSPERISRSSTRRAHSLRREAEGGAQPDRSPSEGSKAMTDRKAQRTISKPAWRCAARCSVTPMSIAPAPR